MFCGDSMVLDRECRSISGYADPIIYSVLISLSTNHLQALEKVIGGDLDSHISLNGLNDPDLVSGQEGDDIAMSETEVSFQIVQAVARFPASSVVPSRIQ